MALARAIEHDRDSLLRAIAGALVGALPLLFTMEMWWFGEAVSPSRLLVLLGATVPIVVVCLLFGGFRRGHAGTLTVDIPIIFGIATLVSAFTLLVVDKISPGITPLPTAIRMIGVEMIPCAIGAALAITQLRPRETHDHVDPRIHRLPQDLQKILATVAGGVFFAFNIAPTEEPWKMTIEAGPLHFPLLVIVSLLISYMMVFLADFSDRPRHYREGSLGNPLAETLVSYLLSLAISYGFLIGFGHISLSTPLYFQLAATVMLGYVTTIGGSAGRILVAE